MPKRSRIKPYTMGDHNLENSASERYLVDRINKNGTAASITEQTNNRIPGLDKKINEILAVCKQACLMGFPTSMGQNTNSA